MDKKFIKNKTAIIISGPSSSGKTTLIGSKVFKKIFTECLKFHYIYDENYFKSKFKKFSESNNKLALRNDKIIYHYDIIKNTSIFTKKYKYIDGIFDNFEKIIVVICVCSLNELKKRIHLKESSRKKTRPLIKYLNPRSLYYFLEIHKYYDNNNIIFENYLKWISYIEKHNAKIILYNSSDDSFIHDKKNQIDSIIKSILYDYIQ